MNNPLCDARRRKRSAILLLKADTGDEDRVKAAYLRAFSRPATSERGEPGS